jgi:hypothetical protein
MKTCFTSTHLPGPSVAARRRTYRSTSATDSISGTEWSNSIIAADDGWTCESIRPGRTVLRPRSSTSVASPFVASTCSDAPTATTFPPSTDIAVTTAKCGSAVTIFPLCRMRSGAACTVAADSRTVMTSRQSFILVLLRRDWVSLD